MARIPTVLSVYGTRPDAIKMAPMVLELQKRDSIRHISCVTGQHRQMLDQVLDLFDIKPDHDLDIMTERQSLEEIATRVLLKLPEILDEVQPDIVLVHGDTSTAFVSALSAYYRGFKVGHVEAGLRTPDLYIPFPEEANRRLIDTICSLHLAPTENARAALLNEGKSDEGIFVTGNTVVDALIYASKQVQLTQVHPSISDLVLAENDIVTITAHRRESWGDDLKSIAEALVELADKFPNINFVFPIHLNPIVRENMLPIMEGRGNLLVIEPLGYLDFAALMNRSCLILTDSGGIQEEAPSLGKPVLVMRNVTEREEGIAAGCLKLVGTDTGKIVETTAELLSDRSEYEKMARAGNPYGDGKASWRIANILEKVLNNEAIDPGKRQNDNFHFTPHSDY